MSDKFMISLDDRKLTNKPERGTEEGDILIGSIINSLRSTEATIAELAQLIIQGQSWAPSVWKGHKSNDNFLFSRLLAMDFDSRKLVISPEQVKDRLEEYGIDWKFFHTSFRDTPETRKFRVVFDSGRDLNKEETLNYLNRLHTLFPEADVSSNRLTQFYYGGRELLFQNFNSAPINYDLLKVAADVEVSKNCSSESARKIIDRKIKDKELPFTIGLPAIYDIISKPDFDRLCDRVAVIASIRGGAIEATEKYRIGDRLEYPDLLTALTNLLPFKGGLKQAQIWMNEDGRYTQKHYRIFNSLRKHIDYWPTNLAASPFEADHRYTNAPMAYSNGGQAEKQPNVVQYAHTLEKGQSEMESAIDQALNDNKPGVVVLKFPTGIGKSRKLVEIFANTKRPYGYFFATHDLLNQFLNELSVYLGVNEDEIEAAVTPQQPDGIPGEIVHLYEIGANAKAQEEIRRLKKRTTNPELKQKLLEYEIRNSNAYGETRLPVIGTHRKGLTKNYRDNRFPFSHCKTMIFDEDILGELIPTGTVTGADLDTLRRLIKSRFEDDPRAFDILNCMVKYYIDIIDSSCPIIRDIPVVSIPDPIRQIFTRLVVSNADKFTSPILDLFRVRGKFCLDHTGGKINFVTKKELPTDRKIVILSATADEDLYRQLIPDIKFVNLDNVVPVGKLIQDTSRSFSRISLENSETLNYVKTKLEEYGDPPVITFKPMKDLFFNACPDIHFGKCSGSNDYTGKDIAVVGTPHPPESVVVLIAALLNMYIPEEVLMVKQEIFRNGFRFMFRTFENLSLQAIQFALIERELIQAVGRARLLRYDAKVYLFSNFPLPDYSDAVVLQ
jgi:hypothetical protein